MGIVGKAFFSTILSVGALLVYFLFLHKAPVGFENTRTSVLIKDSNFTWSRSDDGVATLWITEGKDKLVDYARAVGYAHARDRLFQMYFLKLVSQGRLSETLVNSDKTFQIDIFMRQRGFYKGAVEIVKQLTAYQRSLLEGYAEGINYYVKNEMLMRPIELIMVQYELEAWTPADTLSCLRIMGYLGLAQAQEEAEKFIIETIQNKGDKGLKLMQSLFKPHLDNIPDEIIELIKKVNLEISSTPRNIQDAVEGAAIPTLKGSNNWIVAPEKTKSGYVLHASDPHLDTARLPAIWSEIRVNFVESQAAVGPNAKFSNFFAGITVPGAPAITMGRTKFISFSFTYGFADLLDYFFEDCTDDLKCKVDGAYEPVEQDVQEIKRKGANSTNVTFYRSRNGIIELADPTKPMKGGLHLARAFAYDKDGGLRSVEGFINLLLATNTKDAVEAVEYCEISTNTLLGDSKDIAYVQTGLVPNRNPKHSGLFPVPGWKKEYRWNGFVNPKALKHEWNPSNHFIATANNNHNPENLTVVNLHMGSYRKDRIADMLNAIDKVDVADLKRMQGDLYSKQGELFMAIAKQSIAASPKLKESQVGKILSAWDLRYNKESQGAYLFDKLVQKLYDETYAKFLGQGVWEDLKGKGVYFEYFSYFDKAILNYNSELSGITFTENESQIGLFARALEQIVDEEAKEPKIKTYGDVRPFVMQHMFFRDVLPQSVGIALGFHYGPIQFEGSKSTVQAGSLFKVAGNVQSFAASYRYVTDMGKTRFETVLPGGPSENRFINNLYTADLERFYKNQYKVLVE